MSLPSESSATSSSLAAALRLALVPGVGPRIRQKLLEKFGSSEAVFSASYDDLRTVERVGPKLCRAIQSAHEDINVEAEIDLCRTTGVQILPDSADSYPRLLQELPDPPGILFVKGNFLPVDAACLS
jgi:DNA processing protein